MKACSGRPESKEKGLDMRVRLTGGVPGELLSPLVLPPMVAYYKKTEKQMPVMQRYRLNIRYAAVYIYIKWDTRVMS